MTTLQQIELQCPICETRFRSQTVVSTNSFGGKRTDFHERAAGTQPLPFLIHTCNRCGFSGSERDFTEDVEVSTVLKERVWNELAPSLTTGAFELVYDGRVGPSSTRLATEWDYVPTVRSGELHLGLLASDDDGRTWADPVTVWR